MMSSPEPKRRWCLHPRRRPAAAEHHRHLRQARGRRAGAGQKEGAALVEGHHWLLKMAVVVNTVWGSHFGW